MLTVDQIPYEVKRAMRGAWAKRNNSDAPEKIMADLAVAMLNAWPGGWIHEREGITGKTLSLPLTQENNDGSD
jgi:hypothetical protein